MVSRVFMICDAYESGYGHGLKEDGKDLSETPHSDPELGEAYQTGYEAGEERAEDARKWRDERITELEQAIKNKDYARQMQLDRISELEEKVRFYNICMNTGGIDEYVQDAARYRWLCEKYGQTYFPSALEHMLRGNQDSMYIAYGKASIDEAIDAARNAA